MIRKFLLLVLLSNPSTGNGETGREYITKNAIYVYGSGIGGSLAKRLSAYRVIMLGEVHGSSEYPQFALDLVRHLQQHGTKVTLGLEIPANFQDQLREAASKKDYTALLETEFFKSRIQDGRQTLAMASLILAMGTNVEILCFDKATSNTAHDRDLEMARNVTSYAKNNPTRTLVILAGNYHTRVVEKVADPAFTPMGYYLSHVDDPIDRSQILSVMGRAGSGSTWSCHTPNPDECGVKSFTSSGGNYEAAKLDRYFLFEPALQDGHDATFFVNTLSASPPLQTEFPFWNKCQASPQQVDLLMHQEFWTFDQTPFGHRYLFKTDTACSMETGQIIDTYLVTNRNILSPFQLRILHFHGGQSYAEAKAYGVAVNRFQNTFNPDEEANPEFHWNAYVAATIAFLQRDREALLQARRAFPEKLHDGDALNARVVDRFIKCFDSTYSDAYSGTGTCSL